MGNLFKLDTKTLARIQIQPGKNIRLQNYDTSWVHYRELEPDEPGLMKKEAKAIIRENILHLSSAQERLYASGSHGILILFQGMDAAGKDGAIKHVMSGINPQGCRVYSFKEPSTEELNHHFLWRYTQATPSRGQISIFNRSHYEDVVTVRVHPEWLDKQHIRKQDQTQTLWANRYKDINNFEQSLNRSGIVILKFFLHMSKEEQKKRLLVRLNDENKHWKFSPSDFTERAFWKDYQRYYGEAISHTSTPWAPWHVIPSDSKWAARALIADVISTTIRNLPLRPRKPSPALKKVLSEFIKKMEKN